MWTMFSQLFGKRITRWMVDAPVWERHPADTCYERARLRERLSARYQRHGPRAEEVTVFEALPVPYYDGS